jgi:large subunit ribosomal protein L7e
VNNLLLAFRIREARNTPAQAQKILKEIGLKDLNNVVLVRSDATTQQRLRLIKDYITYGVPTKQIVNNLVRKRGFLKKNKDSEKPERVPIKNNTVVEEELGEAGLICIEDIIDGIISGAKTSEEKDTFSKIQESLWPFQVAKN